MKRVVRYLQNQALEYSDERYSSAAYLSPRRNHEPQQRAHHGSHHHHDSEAPFTKPAPGSSSQKHTRTSPRRTPTPSRISSNIQRVQYASQHILQSYELYIPPAPSATFSAHASGASTPLSPGSGVHTPVQRYWVVYVHGGYFRDPNVLATSFHPALALLSDPDTHDDGIREMQRHVKGYVSINYRLARHEGHPQDPEKTGSYELREAIWPEMLDDVVSALKHWQRKYPEVGARYLLVGHSVGATLALNAVLEARQAGLVPPMGVVGLSGIYDFVKLHESFPSYKNMTANAVDEDQWSSVSPAQHSRAEFDEAWAGASGKKAKRWLILAHSRTDGLVDWGQVEGMQHVFDEGDTVDGGVMCEVVEVKGRHNEVWENGKELARMVREGIGEVMGVDQ